MQPAEEVAAAAAEQQSNGNQRGFHGCSCPSAGWCERHKTKKDYDAHRLCQNDPVFRDYLDRRARNHSTTRPRLATLTATPIPPRKPCVTCGKKRTLREKVAQIFQASWNFSKAMAHWGKGGFKFTTEEQYDERGTICAACPSGKLQQTAAGDQCGDCLCLVALKAAIIENTDKSDCPLGHWPIITQPTSPKQERLPKFEVKRNWTYQHNPPIDDAARTILMRINKGLGDAMCFRTVLLTLKELRPNWTIDVNCHSFHSSVYSGLCRQIVLDKDLPSRFEASPYDTQHVARFMRPKRAYEGYPCNTTQAFLRDVCRVAPTAELSTYGRLEPSAEELEHARAVVAPLGSKVILWHGRGRSFPHAKNPHYYQWLPFLEHAQRLGYTVLALNFDRNNEAVSELGLPEVTHDTPGFGHGHQSATQLAALMSQVSLFVGVDSGPLHVAGATQTPTIGVWLRHHPCHSYNVAPNVLHLVPVDHEKNIPHNGREHALEVFQQHYRHSTYTDFGSALVVELEKHDAATGGVIP